MLIVHSVMNITAHIGINKAYSAQYFEHKSKQLQYKNL
jgi:hypothetical protein